MKNKKKKTIFIMILLILTIVINVEAKDYTKLEKPTDNGAYFNNLNFTWSNPDPTVIKVGSSYYSYSTNCAGINVYKTDNFKDWTKLDPANTNDRSTYSCYWAPEVYYYNNKYYMFYTGVINAETSPTGQAIRKLIVSYSSSPEGPFTHDTILNSNATNPIDPTVLFDGSKVYLYSKADINGAGATIYVEELNSDLMSVKSSSATAVLTLQNANTDKDKKEYWERDLVEGPFVMKINNTYYLMYTTGSYSKDTYTVSYATSSSPTGPFTRVTIGDPVHGTVTPSLLHGDFANNDTYDSTKNLYATGHHFILKNTDNEMYIAYHSAMFTNNVFKTRSLNFDQIGVDKNGKLYVNGPTKVNQPLPSGVNGLYKVESGDYDVIINNNKVDTLKDYINYNALNTATVLNKTSLNEVTTTRTTSLNVTLSENKDVQDIWLYGTSTGFNNTKCDIIINDKYSLEDNNLGTTGNAKIQLPTIKEGVKSIQINFKQEVELSEVNLYTTNRTPEEADEEEQKEETQVINNFPNTAMNVPIIISIIGILSIVTGVYIITRTKKNKEKI